MRKQMNALSALGLFSRFVGMLTDSRSFISYPRHEYFRRILCSVIGEDVELFRNFGFNGIHYLDVYSILIPEPCCDPRHPLTRDEAAEWSRKTLEFFRDGLGGVASEGGWDFCAGSLDYVLYPVFHLRPELPAICDRTVPFWHLVYHGILLYNSACDTVNAAVKSDRRLFLRNMELGGRPLDYFYADFVSNGEHWLGCEDLIGSLPISSSNLSRSMRSSPARWSGSGIRTAMSCSSTTRRMRRHTRRSCCRRFP